MIASNPENRRRRFFAASAASQARHDAEVITSYRSPHFPHFTYLRGRARVRTPRRYLGTLKRLQPTPRGAAVVAPFPVGLRTDPLDSAHRALAKADSADHPLSRDRISEHGGRILVDIRARVCHDDRDYTVEVIGAEDAPGAVGFPAVGPAVVLRAVVPWACRRR